MGDLTTVRYVAADGSRLSDADAARIGGFIERRFGNSPCTAADVVKAARPARSPIHRDFEWRDDVAAERYREDQARSLLRSIHVVFANGEPRPPTRAFHHVALVDATGATEAYAPARVVWSTPDLATQVKERAHRELAAWAARYRDYGELSELAVSVERLLEASTA